MYMGHTIDGGGKSMSTASGWGMLGTLLGAAGAATGITALATKVPKNNGCHRNGCGGWNNGGCGCGDGYGYVGPSAFQSWAKGCDDAVELTQAIYNGRIRQMEEAREAREVDVNEKFQIWKSQVDADFDLYKTQRDGFDALAKRIGDLETKVAVGEAILPYQHALINCKIDRNAERAEFNLYRRTCRMIEGDVVLPSTPTVTGFLGASRCRCQAPATAPAA